MTRALGGGKLQLQGSFQLHRARICRALTCCVIDFGALVPLKLSRGPSKNTTPRSRGGLATTMRLSGLQKEILGLYRQCLRECRKKPSATRQHFQSYARYVRVSSGVTQICRRLCKLTDDDLATSLTKTWALTRGILRRLSFCCARAADSWRCTLRQASRILNSDVMPVRGRAFLACHGCR